MTAPLGWFRRLRLRLGRCPFCDMRNLSDPYGHLEWAHASRRSEWQPPGSGVVRHD